MDPGHDDALALLVALALRPVVGVSAVAGNQT
ncbi:MAG: nucleoside hydrolase, partial [Firmicutes bacterium]|nr:nucleoside hydrolase [Bacillota bacterium]